MSVTKNIFKCPDVSFWEELINGLLAKNKQVVLLGGNDDEELMAKLLNNEAIKNNPNFINYFKKTKSLLELAYIMQNSDSVICVDSAPLHVALCSKAKTFAIFGPTNEVKLVPCDSNITVIKNNSDCRPCLWHKRSCNCENSICLNIDAGQILSQIN